MENLILNTDPGVEIAQKTRRKLIHGKNLMTVVIDFNNGPMEKPDPPHSHVHEQNTYVAKGELYFFLGEKKFHLKEGDAIAIPSAIPHCIQTLSEHVRLVDSFNPIREDFLKS